MSISLNCMNKANDTGFKLRIKYLMQKAAIDILGEDDLTAGHAERVIYAKSILDGSANIYEFAIGVTTNSTVATAIDGDTDPSDNDLEFVVNSMINDFAGID